MTTDVRGQADAGGPADGGRWVGFGPFSFDPETLELRREGNPVRLQPQPSQVLALLISKAGRLVTRDELRDGVWRGRVLEFDGGLNFAIRKIRQALDDDASDPRYVETVHGRGYRFIAELDVDSAGPPAGPWDRGRPRWRAPTGGAGLPLGLGVGFAVGVAIAVTLLAGFGWRIVRAPAGPPLTRGPPVLVVLPLEDLDASPGGSPVSSGLTADLITELTRFRPDRLSVLAPASVAVLGDAASSGESLRTRLGAEFVVRGSVRREADAHRVSVRVERTSDGALVWAGRYDRPSREVLDLQTAIAADVAAALSVDVASAEAGGGPVPLAGELRDSLFAARWLLGRASAQSLDRALSKLEAVLEAAPNDAWAWALTAQARRRVGDVDGATVAASRAVDLDPRRAEAYFELGQLAQARLDLPEAVSAFRRAAEVAPGNSLYHQRLADALANTFEFTESILHIELARRLDPASTSVAFDLYMVYVAARRWHEARRHCEASRDLSPLDPWPHACLLTAAYFERDWSAAATHARALAELQAGSSRVPATLDGDDRAVVRGYFAWELEDQSARLAAGEPVPEYALARAAGRLQDRARVLGHLRNLVDTRDFSLQWAPREVWFDFLRGDPEFERVLREVGLPVPPGPARE